MVKIFKKTEKKKILPEDGKVQLAEASRRLGFEVGYHRHSEIGWVQEKLSQIYKFADEYDLRDFVKKNYDFGKEEGSKEKARDTKTGLSRGIGSSEAEQPPSVSIEETKIEHSPLMGSGYKKFDTNLSGSSDVTLQPSLVDLPDNIERTKSIERPALLDGIKHLTPKKSRK